jgi:hypothetical protein
MLGKSIALITVAFAALAWNSEPLELVALASSVKGAGTIHFGASDEHVTVNTSGSSGRATFNDRTASGHVTGTIDVNCVRIVGSEATISGIVTKTNRSALQGFEAVFQIRDNGTGRGSNSAGPDLMSPVKFHAVGTGSDCQVPEEFDLTPVKGNFTVQP